MSETRTIHDPFLNKQVEISSALVDRLRGKYAVGPTLENGEPEFGWRQHETPPIQHEAALEIMRLRAEAEILKDIIKHAIPSIGFHWSMTKGGPAKSSLLHLRREAEGIVGP